MKSVAEIEAYLEQYVANASKYTGKDITVERMWPLLALVGSPEKQLKVVHIAGTSGKTSTAYYVGALLKEAGNKVGLTVSPHVSSITERLQINGQPIPPQQFCELFQAFMNQIGEQKDASYFELMIVFILWSFVQLGVDYAVVETGMGGLHDSTNVLRRDDKVCVITDIGLDHQHVLGDTIKAIAQQKAGIIHKKNHVFAYNQNDVVTSVLRDQCHEIDAQLHVVEPIEVEAVLPAFQKRNWQLAYVAYVYVATRDALAKLSPEQLKKTHIAVPGRMQKVMVDEQTFILDGAHNAQKMNAFVASFQLLYPDQKVPVLLAMKQGKDYKDAIEILQPIISSVICTEFQTHQDLPIHAIPAGDLADSCKKVGITDVTEIPILQDAVQALQARGERLNLVTGSFYLVGDVLQYLALA